MTRTIRTARASLFALTAVVLAFGASAAARPVRSEPPCYVQPSGGTCAACCAVHDFQEAAWNRNTHECFCF